MGRKNKNPVRLNAKNQVKVGYHGTTAPESALGVGDTLIPPSKRRGAKRSQASLDDHTYLATTEEGAWAFNMNMAEQEGEDRHGNRVAPPRTRVFKTAPSQDQSLDPNYVRSRMEGYKQMQEWGQRPQGVRSMIDHVKGLGHRVASSQVILSQQFGPPAPPGGRTDIALAGPNGKGGDFNWHEYGYSNWRKHSPNGMSTDSLGRTEVDVTRPEETADSQSTTDWNKGTLGKSGKLVPRPKPLRGDQTLPLGDEWTKPSPSEMFG